MPSFSDLGLPAPVLERVTDLGFVTPTAIQEASIPVLLSGRDLVGVAQTGTGKTAAFGLPMIAHLDPSERRVQGLVLAPTRELALQVAEALTSMAPNGSGLRVLPIYGGSPFGPQLRGLSEGAHVVVGTPGRMIDLISRGALDLSDVRMLVLDEADEMLRMGFAEEVAQILEGTPDGRQTALFSATMPPAIRRVAGTYMTDPAEVRTQPSEPTTSSIEQTYAVVPFRHKNGALARVLATSDAEAAIVFVSTRATAEDLGADLVGRGINAATISGDVPQAERERIVERLRAGTLSVLVATDVAARGLDVERIGLVVNYDVPRETEAYVHRIGRTGRAGRSGRALTFLTPREQHRLRSIERATRTTLAEAPIPTPAQVSAHKAAALLAQVPERLDRGRTQDYADRIRALAEESGTDVVEIAAGLLALGVGDPGPVPWREQQGDRPEDEDARATFAPTRAERSMKDRGRTRTAGPTSRGEHGPTQRPDKRGRPARSAGTVYRVAVGRNHGAQPGGIVGALTGEGGLVGSDVGKIEIFSSFSLVEITRPIDDGASRRIGAARVGGRMLKIRPDTGRPGRPHRRRD